MGTGEYTIKISPGVIKGDIFQEKGSWGSTGYYSAMTNVLSGGTNGTSLLTGLTIPILIEESIHDLGFYSPFDGAILQKDVITNFIFSADSIDDYTILLYNTSEQYASFLELSSYSVDWGDGSQIEQVTQFSPSYVSHQFPKNLSGTTILLKQTTPWGVNEVKKYIRLPYSGETEISNINGTITFTPNQGSWSGIPVSYDYIFTGDSENNINSQITDNYPQFTTTPFWISGFTQSRINELKFYGSEPYKINQPLKINGEEFGVVTSKFYEYTGYTIQGVDYYDYSDGTTLFMLSSSGITSEDIISTGITKDERFLNMAMQPEVYSDIFIERGKNSALERVQRLNEVDNLGDLERYGYGFFNIKTQ